MPTFSNRSLFSQNRDAYMTCSGLTSAQPEHVKIMAHFSIDLLHAASTTLIDESDPSRGHVEVRAGFHSGPVASHVVGLSNPRYSIIGDSKLHHALVAIQRLSSTSFHPISSCKCKLHGGALKWACED